MSDRKGDCRQKGWSAKRRVGSRVELHETYLRDNGKVAAAGKECAAERLDRPLGAGERAKECND